MSMIRYLLLVFWILSGFQLATADAAPIFNQYVGVLRHPKIQRDQLVKLDFIFSREEGNNVHLKAIFTLYFGDFRKGEYVAYHFDNVRFNLITQDYVFDQADQPVTLIGKQTGPNEFSGELRSVYSGELGTVLLGNDRPANPELPLMDTLWGEYRGKCESSTPGMKVENTVQLYTYRSTEGAGQVGNPFRAYRIKGIVAQQDAKGCLGGGKDCIRSNISSGSYNFFENRLNLFGGNKNFTCSVEPNALICRGCEPLKRVSEETKGPRIFAPPQVTSPFPINKPEKDPALEGEVSSIQGKYSGYLHHEFLDRYQIGSLNLLAYQAPGESGEPSTLRLSALATLYFGSQSSSESLSYRFKERAYPNPLLAPQFLFNQEGADVDAILQVTSLGKGIVKGVWFSQLFGRVGSFEFRKEGLPNIPKDAKLMEEISGEYESSDWELGLIVNQGVAPPNTDNPFAPLTFQGWTLLPRITPRIPIMGGSFDFYTGRIGVEVEGNITLIGERPDRKRLYLKKLNYGLLAPLPPHELTPYRITPIEGSEKEE